eukprot:1619224-Amphidinium_carterae.1
MGTRMFTSNGNWEMLARWLQLHKHMSAQPNYTRECMPSAHSLCEANHTHTYTHIPEQQSINKAWTSGRTA